MRSYACKSHIRCQKPAKVPDLRRGAVELAKTLDPQPLPGPVLHDLFFGLLQN
jgi:hypothetical protein